MGIILKFPLVFLGSRASKAPFFARIAEPFARGECLGCVEEGVVVDDKVQVNKASGYRPHCVYQLVDDELSSHSRIQLLHSEYELSVLGRLMEFWRETVFA